MEKFTTLTGVAAPLNMINVDTDAIIPKKYLKTIKRTGLGDPHPDETRRLVAKRREALTELRGSQQTRKDRLEAAEPTVRKN